MVRSVSWLWTAAVVVVMTLLVSVQGQVTPCSQDGPCRCSNDQGTIDLSYIPGAPSFPDQLDRQGLYKYSFSPCNPFTEGTGDCTNVAACQVSTDGLTTYPIGSVSSAVFGSDDAGGVIVVYYSSDSTGALRTTVVTLACDETADPGTLDVVGENPLQPSTYTMTLTSKYACFQASLPPSHHGGSGGGLSVGSVLCIALVGVVLVYVAGGVAFQKGVRKASGTEVIPNHSLWTAMPGLVKDGVVFTFGKCRRSSGYNAI